ncbi:MAG: DUF4957 domain-containing protein [candidate division Zixibacteria bacterium]|nr:DUF4957 domain-containing protein [candidate division Zixibacteria bacterium]
MPAPHRAEGWSISHPGGYTTGTLYLRSHVRLFVESGATVYSSRNAVHYPKTALFYGEDVEHITLEGRGVINGRGEYEWRLTDHDDRYILPNQRRMEALGKHLMRAFPKPDFIGNLVLLLRCRDVLIQDLSFIDSPSWTMHLCACERVIIDRVYVRTSKKSGVWADGIDPNGCRDVRISNSTIDTGDDAIVFYSNSVYGPALPCENITVSNCRLSSASSALKFCDGNENCVRNVTIDNCVISESNRGIAFMVFDGGYVSDVVISNLTIDCRRYDWFWWGEGDPLHFRVIQRSEIHPEIKRPDEPPVGSIRNVLIKNVLARGKGPSTIQGHATSLLDGVTFEDVRLILSTDPDAPYDNASHGMIVEHARNLRLDHVEVVWENPLSEKWQIALSLEDIQGLELSGFRGRGAHPGHPAIRMHRVEKGEG